LPLNPRSDFRISYLVTLYVPCLSMPVGHDSIHDLYWLQLSISPVQGKLLLAYGFQIKDKNLFKVMP
jgi:hypothetical protein